jgi:MFS family permease
MMFLYTFGNIIGDLLGNRRVISLYVWGAIAGGLAYLLVYNTIPFFLQSVLFSTVHGASASVFAIVVGAATLTPDYRLNLILLGPVRIKYIAAFYVVLSYAQTIGSNAGGNVAHLGGALVGYLFIRQLQNGNDWGKPVHFVIDFFKGLFKPKPKMKVTYNRDRDQSPSQAEIDIILDKISVSGYESLTKEEKQKLFSASKK